MLGNSKLDQSARSSDSHATAQKRHHPPRIIHLSYINLVLRITRNALYEIDCALLTTFPKPPTPVRNTDGKVRRACMVSSTSPSCGLSSQDRKLPEPPMPVLNEPERDDAVE